MQKLFLFEAIGFREKDSTLYFFSFGDVASLETHCQLNRPGEPARTGRSPGAKNPTAGRAAKGRSTDGSATYAQPSSRSKTHVCVAIKRNFFSRSINVKKAASVVAVVVAVGVVVVAVAVGVVVAVVVALKWSSLIGNGQKAREKDVHVTISKKLTRDQFRKMTKLGRSILFEYKLRCFLF